MGRAGLSGAGRSYPPAAAAATTVIGETSKPHCLLNKLQANDIHGQNRI